MENEPLLIVTDRKTLREILEDLLRKDLDRKSDDNFERDRISKPQAAKLIGISQPTLDKRVKEGKFREYNVGSRKYFLRSEVIQALKSME